MIIKENDILFYGKDLNIDRVDESSAQANVLFGKEKHIGQKVVCKQYSVFKLKAMLKEIRVFSCIEKQRLAKCQNDSNLLRRSFHQEDGLPKLLSYKLSLDGGELLMRDAGKSLDKWYQMGFSRAHRMRFTC